MIVFELLTNALVINAVVIVIVIDMVCGNGSFVADWEIFSYFSGEMVFPGFPPPKTPPLFFSFLPSDLLLVL